MRPWVHRIAISSLGVAPVTVAGWIIYYKWMIYKWMIHNLDNSSYNYGWFITIIIFHGHFLYSYDKWMIYDDWLVVEFQPLWKMMEFVSWDDEIPNWMESHKIPWFQTTNQYKYRIPMDPWPLSEKVWLTT